MSSQAWLKWWWRGSSSCLIQKSYCLFVPVNLGLLRLVLMLYWGFSAVTNASGSSVSLFFVNRMKWTLRDRTCLKDHFLWPFSSRKNLPLDMWCLLNGCSVSSGVAALQFWAGQSSPGLLWLCDVLWFKCSSWFYSQQSAPAHRWGGVIREAPSVPCTGRVAVVNSASAHPLCVCLSNIMCLNPKAHFLLIL